MRGSGCADIRRWKQAMCGGHSIEHYRVDMGAIVHKVIFIDIEDHRDDREIRREKKRNKIRE